MNFEQWSTRRNSWYAAYFAGDIASLQEAEHPDFCYLSEQGVETTGQRYATIRQKLAAGSWFPDGGHREEFDVTYHTDEKVCAVFGCAKIILGDIEAPDTQHTRFFNEVWLYEGGKWRIACLQATVCAT